MMKRIMKNQAINKVFGSAPLNPARAGGRHYSDGAQLFKSGHKMDGLGEMGKGAWNSARHTARWMNRGSGGQVAAKYGAAVLGAGAAGTAGRIATGSGGAFEKDGQRNIAGVPFL